MATCAVQADAAGRGKWEERGGEKEEEGREGGWEVQEGGGGNSRIYLYGLKLQAVGESL